MIKDTKLVKAIEEKKTTRGSYHKVIWMDDKSHNVFDAEMVATCFQALEGNLAIKYTTDKNDKGYWELLTAQIVTTEMMPEPVHAET